jgi:hypothetical protein
VIDPKKDVFGLSELLMFSMSTGLIVANSAIRVVYFRQITYSIFLYSAAGYDATAAISKIPEIYAIL